MIMLKAPHQDAFLVNFFNVFLILTMSTNNFVIDSNGNRIITDILVTGYIKEIEKIIKIYIPTGIKKLIFDYWLINICDEWLVTEKLTTDVIKVNGFCIDVLQKTRATIYGTKVISPGNRFTWIIKINKYFSRSTSYYHPCVGIIQNDAKIMENNKTRNSYTWSGHGYFYAGNTADIRPANWSLSKELVQTKYNKTGDIIYVNLDLINYTLSYKINDNDLGVIFQDIKKSDYRLTVTVAKGTGSQFELC